MKTRARIWILGAAVLGLIGTSLIEARPGGAQEASKPTKELTGSQVQALDSALIRVPLAVRSILDKHNKKHKSTLGYTAFARRALNAGLRAKGLSLPEIQPSAASSGAASLKVSKVVDQALTEVEVVQILKARLKQLTGLKPPPNLQAHVAEHHRRAARVKAAPRLRASLGAGVRQPAPSDSRLDWRDKGWVVKNTGIVTAVQNQESCGCCWAFATIAAVEASYAFNDVELIGASEQDLLNCAGSALTSTMQQPFDCASGGWWAFDMLWPNRPDGPLGPEGATPGVARRTKLPFTGEQEACQSIDRPYQVQKWDYVSQDNDPNATPTKEQIKAALCKYGPLVSAVYVPESDDGTNAWALNQGDVIQDVPSSSAPGPNHAIVIVGWDDNKGGGSWIIKNSWSTDWGAAGFGYVKYDYNQIGFGAAWVIAAPMPKGS